MRGRVAPCRRLAAYVSDPVAERVLNQMADTFGYILVGLVLLGLPTAYGLRRLRSGNLFAYGLAGLVTDAFWGAITLSSTAFPLWG